MSEENKCTTCDQKLDSCSVVNEKIYCYTCVKNLAKLCSTCAI